MKVLALLSAALLHFGQSLAETVPTRGVADARIRTAAYDANEVYRIQGYVGYEIDLRFEQGESFVGIGAGDIDALSFVSQDNHLFIKPKAARINTNLTVLTTRRTYEFAYSVSPLRGGDTLDAEVIFAVHFTYPRNNVDIIADGVDRLFRQSGSEHPRNGDYWYCGTPTIQPTSASDDGIHTRLRFAAKGEQPAIFVRNDDGSESLVNFSMDAGDVVIHRVVRKLIVRRGRLTGTIFNKAYTGSGERLESGTVSSKVERVGEGRRP